MVRSAGVALALLLLAAPSKAQEAAPKTDAEKAVAAAIEPYKEEMIQAGSLMFILGACDRHIRQEDMAYYIKEFMTAEDKPGLEGEFLKNAAGVMSRLYLSGKADAGKQNLSSSQCQSLIRVSAAAVEAAQKARVAKTGG